MGTELARREVTLGLWQTIQAIAPTMQLSHLFGSPSAEATAAVMLMGHELGFGFTASLKFINIIKGKPCLSPKGALALIHASGLLEDWKWTEENHSCTVWMRRTNGLEFTTTFSLDDARKAGLVTQAGTIGARGQVREESAWGKYEKNMLRWRALGFCEDVLFPDLLGGLYRADEFGARIADDGSVIENEPQAAPPQTNTEPVKSLPEPSGITLEDLLEIYTAEQIVANNEGRVPATEDELIAVATKLAENA